MAENGSRWQLAFWVVTVICGVWLVGLSAGMINNDRLRATEDQRVEDKIEIKLDKIITIQTAQQIDMGKVLTRLGIYDERANSRTNQPGA
uniref:Uncharacterized protein n=1 Tax=viral metagenome TaxID=1070528 RepID=A0A6M3JIF4_9ZZZZ